MRYMLVTFFKKPNGQVDEQIGYAQKLKDNDLSMCNIIIDFKERKLEKCVIEGKVLDTDFDRMCAYYKEIYPQLIKQLEQANI